MVVATAPTVTKGRLYLTNGSQEERIQFSGVSGTTLQNLTRGLSQTADPATSGTGLTWLAGNKVILVAMHDQIPDKQEATTFTAGLTPTDITFSGTTTGGLKVKSLTTAQRDLITPANGMIIYNSTAGEFQIYQGGAWSTMASGSTQPDASTTVAGKVEKATDAEVVAGTATGGTGAALFVTPDDLAQQIQSGSWVAGTDAGGDDTYVFALTPTLAAYTANQVFNCKVTTTNTGACSADFGPGALAIKTRDGNDPQTGVIRASSVFQLMYNGTNFTLLTEDFATATLKGVAEMATDAEVVTGTDQTRYTNALQVRANSKTAAGSFTRAGSAGSGDQVVAHGLGQIPRLVEFHYAEEGAGGSTDGVGYGFYNGSTNSCIGLSGTGDVYHLNTSNSIDYSNSAGNGRTATTTVDTTNITIAFTEEGTAADIAVIRVAHA